MEREDNEPAPPCVPAAASRSSSTSCPSPPTISAYHTITPEDLDLLSRLSGKSIAALTTIGEEDELTEVELMELEEQLYTTAASEATMKKVGKEEKETTTKEVPNGTRRSDGGRTTQVEEEEKGEGHPSSIEALLEDDAYMEKVLLDAVMAKKAKQLHAELSRLLKEREALGKMAMSTLPTEKDGVMPSLLLSRPPQKEIDNDDGPPEERDDGHAPDGASRSIPSSASLSPSVPSLPPTTTRPLASCSSPPIPPTATPSLSPRYTDPGSIGLHASFSSSALPRVGTESCCPRSSDPHHPVKGCGGPSPTASSSPTTTTLPTPTTTTNGSSTASSRTAPLKTWQTITLGDIQEVSFFQNKEKEAAYPPSLPTSAAGKGVPPLFQSTLPKKDDRTEKRRSLFMQEMEGK